MHKAGLQERELCEDRPSTLPARHALERQEWIDWKSIPFADFPCPPSSRASEKNPQVPQPDIKANGRSPKHKTLSGERVCEMERARRLERPTTTLARWRSTN